MNTPIALPAITKKLIEQAARNLGLAKCQFKVIAPDGTEYGELEVVTKKKRPYTNKVASGTYARIYQPAFEHAQPGDVIVFDPNTLGIDSKGFYSAASGGAQHLWGNKAHMITTDTKTGNIEIMRLR